MKQALNEDIEATPSSYGSVHLNRDELITMLAELNSLVEIDALRKKTGELKRLIASRESGILVDSQSNGDFVSLRSDVLGLEVRIGNRDQPRALFVERHADVADQCRGGFFLD